MTPEDLVCGSAELAFSFGFYNPQIIDDLSVGRWSGKRPTLFVVDKWYYFQIVTSFDQKAREYSRYISHLLQDDFHQIYAQRDEYRIYRRNGSPTP